MFTISPKLVLNRLLYRFAKPGSKADPIYVFHHVPKCGGTSMVKALSTWFHPVFDYRHGWNTTTAKPIPLEHLHSNHILCGHFDHDPIFLDQRYPTIFTDPRFRVFTFVRDPLHTKISLYQYEKKHHRTSKPLSEFVFERPNYLSERFPVRAETLAAVVDRYYYTGTLENLQQGLDWIAKDAGKPRLDIPVSNRSNKPSEQLLDEGLLAEFRSENTTDYLLYEYIKEREAKSLDRQGRAK